MSWIWGEKLIYLANDLFQKVNESNILNKNIIWVQIPEIKNNNKLNKKLEDSLISKYQHKYVALSFTSHHNI